MMYKDHVKVGLMFGLAGLAVGSSVLGIAWPGDLVLAPAMTSGSADWPDIDHRKSMVTNFFPPITVPLHWAFVWLNRLVYVCTRRRLDPPARTGYRATRSSRRRHRRARRLWTLPSLFRHWHLPLLGRRRGWIDSHRMLTHSCFMALITGALSAWSATIGPLWVTPLLIAFSVLLAGRIIFAGSLLLFYAVAGMAHFGVMGLLLHLQHMGWLWGLSILVGMISHDFADGCTTGVTAFWAPLSWRKVRLPTPPFDTGGFFETRLLPALLFVGIALSGYAVFLEWGPRILAGM